MSPLLVNTPRRSSLILASRPERALPIMSSRNVCENSQHHWGTCQRGTSVVRRSISRALEDTPDWRWQIMAWPKREYSDRHMHLKCCISLTQTIKVSLVVLPECFQGIALYRKEWPSCNSRSSNSDGITGPSICTVPVRQREINVKVCTADVSCASQKWFIHSHKCRFWRQWYIYRFEMTIVVDCGDSLGPSRGWYATRLRIFHAVWVDCDGRLAERWWWWGRRRWGTILLWTDHRVIIYPH